MTDTPKFTMEFKVARDDARGGVIAILNLMREICARSERSTADGLMLLLIASCTHWNWWAIDRLDMNAFAEFCNQAFKLAPDWFPRELPEITVQ